MEEINRQRALEESKRLEEEKIMKEKDLKLKAKQEDLRKQKELENKLLNYGRDLALVKEGATLEIPLGEDPSSNKIAAIDGISNDYGIFHGWAASSWEKHGSYLLVSLNELSLVNKINFLLWDKDGRYYHYRVEVSSDQLNWEIVTEKNTGEWRGWQVIEFKPRKLRYVKITGLYNSALLFLSNNPWFHVVEIVVNGVPLSEVE